ncbi:MAG: 4Fe-4S dicluster domain-containing protein [Bacteroidetes bacterium]|nr:4Fe-4S dicluster domain-containing protein [Bacteroidota bacterium]
MKQTHNDCKEEPGLLVPVIDLNACEGKGPCIDVCPYHVLEMDSISDDTYKHLSFFGKLKTAVHGRDKAQVIKPDLCHSCGLCVTVCPEKAIKLKRR